MSAGSEKRWPILCCSASRRGSMRENGSVRWRAARLVRAALELDEKEDGLHKFHFLVVGKRDYGLFVFLGDDEVLAADRDDRILDVLLLLEGTADLRDGVYRSLGDDSVDRSLDREVLVQGR